MTEIITDMALLEQVADKLPTALVVGMGLCFLLMWRWRWRDYRLPAALNRRRAVAAAVSPAPDVSDKASPAVTTLMPPPPQVSVVVPCCNQAEALRDNLPAILSQHFPAFEVIVVDEASTDETRELVTHMAETYPNLRHTFVPESSRYVDRRKLAITLGVRAARAPWVVLTGTDCRPAGPDWLTRLAARFTDDCDFVLGYANYADDATPLSRRAIYERLRRALRSYRAAMGTPLPWRRVKGLPLGKAIGADAANMALRKSRFLEDKGYTDSLTVPCGEDDLLIDALARPGRTAVELHAEATVLQDLPPRSVLAGQRLSHRAVMCHLGRRGRLFLWREGAASCATWLFLLLLLAYVGARAIALTLHPLYATDALPADIAAFVLTVAAIVLPGMLLNRTVDSMGERRFNWLLLAWYALTAPWRNAVLKFRRWRHRRDFVRR